MCTFRLQKKIDDRISYIDMLRIMEIIRELTKLIRFPSMCMTKLRTILLSFVLQYFYSIALNPATMTTTMCLSSRSLLYKDTIFSFACNKLCDYFRLTLDSHAWHVTTDRSFYYSLLRMKQLLPESKSICFRIQYGKWIQNEYQYHRLYHSRILSVQFVILYI